MKIELNDRLAREGIHALETDFAELILQLDGDWSSHILVPAIHRKRTKDDVHSPWCQISTSAS